MADRKKQKARLEERQQELEEALQAAAAEAGLEEGQADSLSELAPQDDEADIGTEMFEREKAVSIVESIQHRLDEVRDALRRLDEGTYGVCEACGEKIPAPRLRARPEARFCVDHQEQAARAL